MPIQFKRRVFATGGSLRVNIPSEITDALKIKKGDTLLIGTSDSYIVMKKRQKGKARIIEDKGEFPVAFVP